MARKPSKELSRERLDELLTCSFETESLDFKETIDLSTTRDVVELAKDVLAFANTRGGHIVVGVEDRTFRKVGVDEQRLCHIQDGPIVNGKLASYCGGHVTVHVATHRQLRDDGSCATLVLMYIPRGRTQVPAQANGSYADPQDGRKQIWAFRSGDVLVRKADQSRKVETPEDLIHRPGSRGHSADTKHHAAPAFQNPYDFSSAASKGMFKGREPEIDKLLDAVAGGSHVAVFGLQRMGKTSLVREALLDRIKERADLRGKTLYAELDIQKLGSEDLTYKDFLHAVIAKVAEAVGAIANTGELARAIEYFLSNASPYQRGRTRQLLDDFSGLLTSVVKRAKRRIVLFLDEFSELFRAIERNLALNQKNPGRDLNIHPHDMLVDVSLMQCLSSLLKSTELKGRLVIVFALRPFVAAYDERRNLQILKLIRPIPLYHLDAPASKALITDPLRGHATYEEGAVDRLCDITAGHPYLIQFILAEVVDRIQRLGHSLIRAKDIDDFAEEMATDGPSYAAQFAVLDSDYSIDDVLDGQRGELGKRALSLIAKLGQSDEGWWVPYENVMGELLPFFRGSEDCSRMLQQLLDAKIIEERDQGGVMLLRMVIPLLRKRYLRQCLYHKSTRVHRPREAGE